MLSALYNNMCYVMTCYIAAGCYVNCVLGYDDICNVKMLHVLSCTFLHEKQRLNKNKHTGYLALDPTANKYFSGSGWEIMYFGFYCFYDSFYVFARSFYVLFCFYMCCFVCKCKSLKTNRRQH